MVPDKGDLAVIYLLVNDSTYSGIVGTRVNPLTIAQGDSFPCAEVEINDSEPFETKSGVSDVNNNVVSVYHYALSHSDLKSMESAAKTALDGQSGSINGVTVEHIKFIGHNSYAEQITNKLLRVTEQQYQVRVK